MHSDNYIMKYYKGEKIFATFINDKGVSNICMRFCYNVSYTQNVKGLIIEAITKFNIVQWVIFEATTQ